jgi:hypothetical protein
MHVVTFEQSANGEDGECGDHQPKQNKKQGMNWQNNKFDDDCSGKSKSAKQCQQDKNNQSERKERKRETRVRKILSVKQMIESTYLVSSLSAHIILLVSLSIELGIGN